MSKRKRRVPHGRAEDVADAVEIIAQAANRLRELREAAALPPLAEFLAAGRAQPDTGQLWGIESSQQHGDSSRDGIIVATGKPTAIPELASSESGMTFFPIVLKTVDRHTDSVADVRLGIEDAKRLVNALGEAIALAEQMQAETGAPR